MPRTRSGSEKYVYRLQLYWIFYCIIIVHTLRTAVNC